MQEKIEPCFGLVYQTDPPFLKGSSIGYVILQVDQGCFHAALVNETPDHELLISIATLGTQKFSDIAEVVRTMTLEECLQACINAGWGGEKYLQWLRDNAR